LEHDRRKQQVDDFAQWLRSIRHVVIGKFNKTNKELPRLVKQSNKSQLHDRQSDSETSSDALVELSSDDSEASIRSFSQNSIEPLRSDIVTEARKRGRNELYSNLFSTSGRIVRTPLRKNMQSKRISKSRIEGRRNNVTTLTEYFQYDLEQGKTQNIQRSFRNVPNKILSNLSEKWNWQDLMKRKLINTTSENRQPVKTTRIKTRNGSHAIKGGIIRNDDSIFHRVSRERANRHRSVSKVYNLNNTGWDINEMFTGITTSKNYLDDLQPKYREKAMEQRMQQQINFIENKLTQASHNSGEITEYGDMFDMISSNIPMLTSISDINMRGLIDFGISVSRDKFTYESCREQFENHQAVFGNRLEHRTHQVFSLFRFLSTRSDYFICVDG